jgi:hypothetical protein
MNRRTTARGCGLSVWPRSLAILLDELTSQGRAWRRSSGCRGGMAEQCLDNVDRRVLVQISEAKRTEHREAAAREGNRPSRWLPRRSRSCGCGCEWLNASSAGIANARMPWINVQPINYRRIDEPKVEIATLGRLQSPAQARGSPRRRPQAAPPALEQLPTAV